MRKFISFLMLFCVYAGMAWGQTDVIEVSTSVDNPENVYAMKNANNKWMTAFSSPTETKPGKFAFFATGTENAFQVYNVDNKKWLSYTKADSYTNGTNKAVWIDTQAEANPWCITSSTNNSKAVYQFAPYQNSGVANIYMNWFEGNTSNPLDNTSTTVGLYSTGASGDAGSAWILTKLDVPAAGTKYFLQDKSGIYLNLVDLGYEPAASSYNQLATLSTIGKPLYITTDADNDWSWSIHTTEDGGNYLHQYTGSRQWNSRVNEEGADFRWKVEIVATAGELYYALRHESGEHNGYLGTDNHTDAQPLYVNINKDEKAAAILQLKLKEYKEGYLVAGPDGATVTYNGNEYAIGETIIPESELTDEDLTADAPEREGFVVNVAVDNANNAIVVSYVFNPTAGIKIILKNKQHNTYLGVLLEGGKLDNSIAPTTKKLAGYRQNNNYKNCWELVAATYNETACFHLYNPYYDWYAGPIAGRNGAIGLSKTTDGAGYFQIELQGDYIVFKCMTYADERYQYIHQVDWGNYSVVDWTADAGASQWAVEVVSEETENNWLTEMGTELTNKKTYLEACELGSGVGQYSGIAAEDKDAVLATLVIPAEGTTTEKIKAAVYALYPITLTINQPAAGFYRIKSMNGNSDSKKGKYLYVSNATYGLSQTEALNSIMYIDENRNIVNYTSGLRVNHYSAPATVGTAAVAWTFMENAKVTGTYSLKYNTGDQQGYFLSDWTGSVTYGQNDANAAWAFEEVTTLPVTFGEVKAATLYAPVALTIPAGVTAYAGSVNGDYVVLTPVSTTIPANTGVILMAEEAKSYDFAVTTTENTVEGNVLTGTVATINTPADANIYTLQAPDNVLKMKRYEGTTLAGFKAYLSMAANQVQAFKLDLGEATGIESILNNANGKMVIYDMNGRRVQQMSKGLYIVNGKKVLVK